MPGSPTKTSDRRQQLEEFWRRYRRELNRVQRKAHAIQDPLWAKEQQEKQKIRLRNARARRLGAFCHHTQDDIADLFILQKAKCAICRRSLKKVGHHVDHIVPLAKGGDNSKYNLQMLCPLCNLTKNARDPIEYMQYRGFLL